MENASKALIIAGAILVAILLIGFAMVVINGSSGIFTTSVGKMEQEEIEMFNATFTNYEGTKVSGTNVRSLLRSVISNNSNNQTVDNKLISIVYEEDAATYKVSTSDLKTNEMSSLSASINTGSTYTVVMSYNSKTGLVNQITITKNSAS